MWRPKSPRASASHGLPRQPPTNSGALAARLLLDKPNSNSGWAPSVWRAAMDLRGTATTASLRASASAVLALDAPANPSRPAFDNCPQLMATARQIAEVDASPSLKKRQQQHAGRRGWPGVSGQRPGMAAVASAYRDVRPSGHDTPGQPRLPPKPTISPPPLWLWSDDEAKKKRANGPLFLGCKGMPRLIRPARPRLLPRP